MRLFGKVNGTIDRFDRAEWLTGPFDMAFEAPTVAPPTELPRTTDTVMDNIPYQRREAVVDAD